MMNAYFIRLAEHMHWANRRTLAALPINDPLSDAVRLLAHVLTTEQIYYERMIEADPWPQDFWPDLSREDCARLIPVTYKHYQHFLAEQSDDALNRRVRYRNSRGDVYHTTLVDMLTHLMVHGEHHRGQIARILRQHGHTPPVTDFITFVRETE